MQQPAVQTAALVSGLFYVVVGVLGFLPFAHPNGALIGLFKVNAIDDLAHVLIGVAGLAAAASVSNARVFCQIVGTVLSLLGIIGFFVQHPLGLLNLGGGDIALHLIGGAILVYFGFLAPTFRR